MARLTIKKAYERVNGTWPESVPPLTEDEAVRAAKRLFRYAMGETWRWPVIVTSGNRYSSIGRTKPETVDGITRTQPALIVNPEEGWKRFVHVLSHAFYWRANPGERPHSKDHARLERKLIEQVVRRGWLDGKLQSSPRPAVTKTEARERRLVAIDKRIEGWERKAKRTASALKRLHTQRRALVRTIEKEAAAASPCPYKKQAEAGGGNCRCDACLKARAKEEA